MTTTDIRDLWINLRAASGKSIPEWAQQLGVDQHVVRNWENGKGLLTVASHLTAVEKAGKDLIIGPKRGNRAK